MVKYKRNDKVGKFRFYRELPKKKRQRYALFICHCGKLFDCQISQVKYTNKLGCGCIRPNQKHGYSINGKRSPEYISYSAMIKRCHNPKDNGFNEYGRRGIKVCERWMDKANGLMNFYADMGPRPSSNHSLDRINNDGNYEPENCRWATPTEQSRNKRSNRFLEYRGDKKTMAEWAEITGISYRNIQSRLILGWDIERVFSEPVAKRKAKILITHKEVEKGITDRAKIPAVPDPVIHHSIKTGGGTKRVNFSAVKLKNT